MNSVQLVGRLTREVDLKFTQSGTAVGTFGLAVDRNFTNQQGERETDFINCVIWRKSAENLANFTRKGSQIGVEGRIQTRNYENQQGQRVYVTEVVVNNFHLLEPRSVTEQRPREGANGQAGGFQQPQQGFNQGGYQQPLQQGFNQQQSQPFNQGGGVANASTVNIPIDDLPF